LFKVFTVRLERKGGAPLKGITAVIFFIEEVGDVLTSFKTLTL